jgi:heterodisulfide reductase subunit A-like polyferredoxin
MLRFLDSETNFATPKPKKKMSAAELRYYDERAPARERDVWRRKAKSQAASKALDLAAEALAAQAARGETDGN